MANQDCFVFIAAGLIFCYLMVLHEQRRKKRNSEDFYVIESPQRVKIPKFFYKSTLEALNVPCKACLKENKECVKRHGAHCYDCTSACMANRTNWSFPKV